MSYLIGIPLLTLLAILQSVLMSHIELLDGRADLVLLAVISWSLTRRSEEAMAWGVIGGFALDFLSGLPFGSNALILLIVTFLVSFLEGRFWEAHLLMPLGVMFVASLIYHLLCTLLVIIIGQDVSISVVFRRIILPSTFLNVIIALPASQLASVLHSRLFPQEVEL